MYAKGSPERGTPAEKSQRLRNALKGGKYLDRIVDKLIADWASGIGRYPIQYKSDAVMVPVPKSSPHNKGAVWPAELLCIALQARYTALETYALISRRHRVDKSAYIPHASDRPSPFDHYHSIDLGPERIDDGRPIVLIDDIVTRESTMIGCTSKLRKAYPQSDITGFAFAQAVSASECHGYSDPVFGTIVYSGGNNVKFG